VRDQACRHEKQYPLEYRRSLGCRKPIPAEQLARAPFTQELQAIHAMLRASKQTAELWRGMLKPIIKDTIIHAKKSPSASDVAAGDDDLRGGS